MPRTHLVVDPASRLRPVDAYVVVVLEVAGPGRALCLLGIAGIAGRDTFQRLRQQRHRLVEQPRPELGDVAVVVTDRGAALREDIAGVELGVHAMPGEAPVGVTGAQCPRERDRAAVAG